MKSTHIKPSSFTQHKKAEVLTDKVRILKLSGITDDMHNNLLFEVGCDFVEKNAPQDLKMLTELKFGFWDWWFFMFLKDDHLLIESDYIPKCFDYVMFKNLMVENEVIINLFKSHFYAQ